MKKVRKLSELKRDLKEVKVLIRSAEVTMRKAQHICKDAELDLTKSRSLLKEALRLQEEIKKSILAFNK